MRPTPSLSSRGAFVSLAATAWMLLNSACSAADDPAAAQASERGQAREAIIGGALDESTAGVVGLALDLGKRGAAGHCSGTLIAPNLVLTARHCVAFTDDEAANGTVEC